MFGHELESDYDWMARRLDDAGLSGFERDNALAMYSRGTLLGSVLCKLWASLRGA